MPRPYKPRGERKIEPSTKGRVLWRPGTPHPLDVLFEEAATLRQELPGHLEELLTSIQHLQNALHTLLDLEQQFADPSAPLSAADRAAFQAVSERFHNRKHLGHLEAVFAVLRRKRLSGRLQAIRAALDLASGLLAEEESLSLEFLQAVQQAQATSIASDDEPLPPVDEGVPDVEEELDDAPILPLTLMTDESQDNARDDESGEHPQQRVYPLLSKEEERVLNLTEPLTPLVTSVQQSRAFLRTFEARLPELRAQLAASNGWFEVFYVNKRRLKEEVKTFLEALHREQKRNRPVPKAIEQDIHPDVARFLRQGDTTTIPRELVPYIFDFVEYGPYAKYRWREAKRTYTVSLGLDTDYPELPF